MTLSTLVPEIAGSVARLAAEMAFAAFAGKLIGDIRRDAADWRLERALGFVVKMLGDGLDHRVVGRDLVGWHCRLLGSEAKRSIPQFGPAGREVSWPGARLAAESRLVYRVAVMA
jgi:hypothetical protein